jgi:hypothetical protein
MLRDTLYANIGETVELRCPYTSHDLQLLWRGPPHLTVLSVGKEIMTSLGNYDRTIRTVPISILKIVKT